VKEEIKNDEVLDVKKIIKVDDDGFEIIDMKNLIIFRDLAGYTIITR